MSLSTSSLWLVALLAVSGAASAQTAPAHTPARPAAKAVAAAPNAAAPNAATGTELQERELPQRAEPSLRVLAPVAGGLTADEVARRTLASSKSVRQKRAELEAAEAKVDQTTVQFFPRLTLKASYTRLSPVTVNFGGALVGALHPGLLTTGPCPGGAGNCVLDAGGTPVGAEEFNIVSVNNNYDLTAQLDIPLSDYVFRLSDAAASASANRQASQLNLQAERLKVQSDARVLFYNWLRAKGQVAVAQASLDSTKARLKDAHASFTLGAISKADLLRLEALEAGTELVVKDAESLEQLAQQQLAIAMDDKTASPYTVGEDVLAPDAHPLGGSLPALVSEAYARRLELRALAEASRSMRRGAGAVHAGSLPRIDAVGAVDYANPNPRYFPPTQEWNATWSVGVAATWTIDDTFANNAQADELNANASAVDAQRAALKDAIRQEVTADYLNRDKARVAIQTTERQVEAAEEAYRVATDLYRVGRATTTELIDAESDLLSARLQALNARIDLKVASAQLRHAVGVDVH
jgi:outer membrane protein TolC